MSDDTNPAMIKDGKDKESVIVMEGTIEETLPNANFRVKLQNDHELLGYLSGRMRRHRIRVTAGDRVQVEISPYDLTRGRVVYRYR